MKIDNKKKKVVIGRQALMNADEKTMNLLSKYQTIGYSVEVQEPKVTKVDKTKKADIVAEMKSDAEALAVFEGMCRDKSQGFFKAKQYYKVWKANK